MRPLHKHTHLTLATLAFFITLCAQSVAAQPCNLSCPTGITANNDPNQCGAVVNYPAPTGNCSLPVCSPPSGSVFPVGVSTVTCRASNVLANACNTAYVLLAGNSLASFNIASPGTVSTPVAIQGLGAGENVLGIDFRPANGQLYGVAAVGSSGRLLIINPATGATTQVGSPFTFGGGNIAGAGVDFNPTVDRLRFVTDTDLNFNINPDTAVVIVQTPLNPGNPSVVASAYSNNFIGATTTTLYGLDFGSDMLVIQNPPASGTLSNVGVFGAIPNGNIGFDISQCTGIAYAAEDSEPNGAGEFYSVNLATGAITFIGNIGTPGAIAGLAIGLAPPSTCSFSVTVKDAQPPTISCPANITVSGPDPAQVVTYPAPTISDNCPGATVTCTPASGSAFPAGVTTVTCTAKDASNNTATCAFTVTVNQISPVGPGSPSLATSEISDQKSGSILIYNVYTSSVTSSNAQDTRINLTNTEPNRSVAVHLFFVNSADCSVADSFICLTPNQTASVLASDFDPGTTGYLVAVASDQTTGCPINFNYLIGDEYVKFSSGHAANLGAEAIAAISTNPAVCNEFSVTAQLSFDGVSYNRIPRIVALDNILSRSDGNDTLLILNRIGGNLGTGAATLSGIFGVFYNDGEVGVSFTFSPGVCQFRTSVNNNFPRITPRFDQFVPSGRSGWLKFYSQNDQGILGAAINFNDDAASSSGAFNQGHNLHKLTFTSSASYTIPVFPPNC